MGSFPVINLFGKRTESFTRTDIEKAMHAYANQFRCIETTGKNRIAFDDQDYEVLRKQALFYDSKRSHVMALWFSSEGKRTVAPVAKLMLDAEGKSVIRYKDKDPFNLRRSNIELISHQAAHFKEKKPLTASGLTPTSIYKGVSWSKFAKKWRAYITTDGTLNHLGYFSVEEDAAEAYNEAAKAAWGEAYSNLNVLPTK